MTRLKSTDESGMTMVEMVVVTMIVALIAGVAGLYGTEWLRREHLRSSLYATFVQISLARVEAVNRNRACRLTIDTSTNVIQVIDLNDPTVAGDDEVIQQDSLSARTIFDTPDASPALTLNHVTGTLYEVTFEQDGSVTSGSGSIHLREGDDFKRVSIYAGGGVGVERWNGTAWESGS